MEEDPEFARAHRAALDHVLALVARSDWGGGLVLRGSMTLQAWFGDRARPPADLDWIVPEAAVFPDPLDPFPYVDDIVWVQQWPEAADGAARYEMWGEEDFETFGLHPVLPPEELRWISAEEYTPPSFLDDLAETIRNAPRVAENVRLIADDISADGGSDYDYDYDSPGERLVVPWYTMDPEPLEGEVRLDFALSETLPDAPIWAPIPRGDGGPPTPVVTASRELSLAWKLLWLHSDSDSEEGAAGKDLYDAVLLAESPDVHLTPALLSRVLDYRANYFTVRAIADWDVKWDAFRYRHPWVEGDLASWLERLAQAVARIMVVRR